jgi:penicillin amidase
MPNWKIIVAVSVSLLISLGYYTIVERPKPKVNGSIQLQGIEDRVEIYRDSYGVPHIYAESERDLFFAQGFVTAQDRLWQMELARHAGSGRLSELFGRVALNADRAIRTLRINAAADIYIEQARPESLEILDAYIAGINASIRFRGKRLPIEFTILGVEPRKWTPEDMFNVFASMALDLQTTYQTIIARSRAKAMLPPELFAEINELYDSSGTFLINEQGEGIISTGNETSSLTNETSLSKITLDSLTNFSKQFEFIKSMGMVPEDFGSNNWVVDGSLSKSGMPLLANDPHLSSRQPATWYEVHLNGPGWHVSGSSLPGVPGVVIGHNENIAWGVTVAYLAMQDLFLEHLNPENVNQYEVLGDWRDAEIITEEILVKGESEPVIHEVVLTHHGPLITNLINNEEAVSLAWAFHSPPDIDVLSGVLDLNQAANWDEFRASVSQWMQDLNFVYADIDGNIGYQMSGQLPKRSKIYEGLPLLGWTAEDDWNGYEPFDTLPHLFNPDIGMIANANNRMIAASLTENVPGEWSVPFRAQQLIEELSNKVEFTTNEDQSLNATIQFEDFTVERMREIQESSDSAAYQQLGRLVLDIVEPNDFREAQLLEGIATWNGVVQESDTIPLFLDQIAREIPAYVFQKRLGADDSFMGLQSSLYYFLSIAEIHRSSPWFDDPDTIQEERLPDVMQALFELAVLALDEEAGSDHEEWTWRKLRQVEFDHALGGVPFIGNFLNRTTPTKGGRFTLNRDTTSYRFIADLSDWSNSLSGITTGQSGHPFSEHYDDQLSNWRYVTPHKMLWDWEDVQFESVNLLVLEPR